MTAVRRYSCPNCGREVVFNDETMTSAHAAPECAWFAQAVKQMGGGPPREVVLDEDGREVKP